MFMTTEQIPPPEHPALRAARVIRQMHVDTIAKIDGGFVFHKTNDAGETVGCSDEMRVACEEQIKLCDGIIENLGRLEHMPPELLQPLELALQDAHGHISKVLDCTNRTLVEEPLPEIGNYDHKEA